MEKASALIKALPSSKVCDSLDSARAAATAAENGKCWYVVQLGKSSLSEVHTALQEGCGQLGVVLVASQSPVSQLEVLRAMEYGGVYVASAELEKPGECLKEAASFSIGPSLVLLAEAAAIRDDERWTSFRYDPRREDQGGNAFVTDSSRVREEIQGFLSRESLLTLIAKKSLPTVSAGDAEAGALSEGLAAASKTVTVLYSSDTGHAEECAKAVARQCRNGGHRLSRSFFFLLFCTLFIQTRIFESLYLEYASHVMCITQLCC